MTDTDDPEGDQMTGHGACLVVYLILLAALCLGAGLCGCGISQEDHDALTTALDDARADLDAAQSALALVRDRFESLVRDHARLDVVRDAERAELRAAMDAYERQIAYLLDYIAQMEAAQ